MTAAIEKLARPEILSLKPYVTAAQIASTVRLNANEVPRAPATAEGLNRYPEIRPGAVQKRLAELFDVPAECLLATRGSTEAIDMLIRAFCRAYTDNIVISPPTFAMYRVYADMQGAAVTEVPLTAPGFEFCPDRVADSCTARSKLIFVCSPNNPTGALVPADDVLRVARLRNGRSLVVADEAYVEFSDTESLIANVPTHENLVVLRTLSKAWGLAGARCGAVIAAPAVIRMLARLLPPYSFSTPVTQCVLQALGDEHEPARRTLLLETVAERVRLARELAALACVQQVWPSHSNFLLVRFTSLEAVQSRLQKAGILIRDFGGDAALRECARITIGDPADNDRLLGTLATLQEAS